MEKKCEFHQINIKISKGLYEIGFDEEFFSVNYMLPYYAEALFDERVVADFNKKVFKTSDEKVADLAIVLGVLNKKGVNVDTFLVLSSMGLYPDFVGIKNNMPYIKKPFSLRDIFGKRRQKRKRICKLTKTDVFDPLEYGIGIIPLIKEEALLRNIIIDFFEIGPDLGIELMEVLENYRNVKLPENSCIFLKFFRQFLKGKNIEIKWRAPW